ncbi:TadE/TadG family type IV pilus assembly protein [Roseimaritima sediminicola]|uniref:TadE/TadG family type IV pilus assembly protein n=1 Tax=Roseimaritima sediminicola TaxID=2662066 RepID=UPI0012982EBC|nr:TadE/TadG family type IV pilus assembly protein [Roseimaritima sediminicola]
MKTSVTAPHRRCLRRPLGKPARAGVTAVEFVFVATIAFVFFFAAFEFCRVAMIRHTVDNAVYEGCRRGIIPGGTAADVSATARQILATIGVDNARITVTPSTITEADRDVSVQIRVPLDSNSFVPTNFFRGKTVQRSLTLQREGTT